MSMWFSFFQELITDKNQRNVWRYPSTGIVCLVSVCLSILMVLLAATSYQKFKVQKDYIIQFQEQYNSITEIQANIEKYEALSRANPVAFSEYQHHKFHDVYTLENFKNYVTQLQKTLKIEWLNIQANDLKKLSDSAVQLNITVDMRVAHDKQFLKFVDQVQKCHMGFVAVKSFDLKRSSNAKKKAPSFEGMVLIQWYVRGK